MAPWSIACGTTNLARPVEPGTIRLSGSIGGPVMEGAPTPTALTSVGVAYGALDGLAVHADLQPTALGAGVLAGDLGVAWNPVPGKGREWLTIGTTTIASTSFRDHMILADGWVSSGTYVGEHVFLAGGAHAILPITTSAESARKTALPMFFALVGYRPGTARVTFELELRWYAPFECGDCVFVPVLSPGGAGAIGLLVGASYDTPKRRKTGDSDKGSRSAGRDGASESAEETSK